jgi:peptidoglycan biosynthesis protein MviN/MurJ (putative lipid II flippase)
LMVYLVVQPATPVSRTLDRFMCVEHVTNAFPVGFVQVQGVSATTTSTSGCSQAALAACRMVRHYTTRLARMARCCAQALLSSTLMVSMASSVTAATRYAFCLHGCPVADGFFTLFCHSAVVCASYRLSNTLCWRGDPTVLLLLQVVSCSQFEAHAGRGARRAPYDFIFTGEG